MIMAWRTFIFTQIFFGGVRSSASSDGYISATEHGIYFWFGFRYRLIRVDAGGGSNGHVTDDVA